MSETSLLKGVAYDLLGESDPTYMSLFIHETQGILRILASRFSSRPGPAGEALEL